MTAIPYEPPTPAFLLRPATNGVHPRVAAASRRWAQHHYACGTCGRADWYAPVAGTLCPAGRALFAAWERVTLRVPVPATYT